MNCESNIEILMECARNGNEPAAALKAHIGTCERCFDRWEAERELSMNLRRMRAEFRGLSAPAAARVSLMQEFESRHARSARPYWYWGAAVAAALLLGVMLGPEALVRMHPPQTVVSAAAPEVESADIQADPDADGFIAVPYAPPLATGELVRIVHTELNPAALASLGVSVDPSWTTQLPADVMEGEDGMPRAVRVSEGDLGDSVY